MNSVDDYKMQNFNIMSESFIQEANDTSGIITREEDANLA